MPEKRQQVKDVFTLHWNSFLVRSLLQLSVWQRSAGSRLLLPPPARAPRALHLWHASRGVPAGTRCSQPPGRGSSAWGQAALWVGMSRACAWEMLSTGLSLKRAGERGAELLRLRGRTGRKSQTECNRTVPVPCSIKNEGTDEKTTGKKMKSSYYEASL